MAKRLRLPMLVITAMLAVVTMVAAASGADVLRSASRSTVTPAPKPRVQKPHASALAQVKALQKQLAKAKAKATSLKKALRKAERSGERAALKQALAKAQAKIASLEKSLAKAKARACDKGYRLSGSRCLATG